MATLIYTKKISKSHYSALQQHLNVIAQRHYNVLACIIVCISVCYAHAHASTCYYDNRYYNN